MRTYFRMLEETENEVTDYLEAIWYPGIES